VAAFVSVPVADASSLSHFSEAPTEGVAGIHAAVLVAEHKIFVLPDGTGGQPFGGLALPVLLEAR
jgi:hypothetical protein